MADLNTVARCAECGEGGAGLKTCKSCKDVKYCSVTCQRLNWPSHKKECKQRTAKLHDESLFKQPPPKDDCPICFLPMLFAYQGMASFYPCCGKVVCIGCDYSCLASGNRKCPFCKTSLEREHAIILEKTMKRVEANDVNSMTNLGCFYANGSLGLQQDRNKALELLTRAAELGSSEAHYLIGGVYYQGVGIEKDVKKAIHHLELAAMAGHEAARYDLGVREHNSGNMERAIKHWTISASAGCRDSMTAIQREFERGRLQIGLYEMTMKAYNDSCAEMRSKAREDAAYFDKNGVIRG
jgi:TPR repeat protein